MYAALIWSVIQLDPCSSAGLSRGHVSVWCWRARQTSSPWRVCLAHSHVTCSPAWHSCSTAMMHFHLVIDQLTVTSTVTQASIKLKMGYSIKNMNYIFISGRPTRALVEIARRLSANKLDWSGCSVNYRKLTHQNKAGSKLSARMMTYERGITE